MAIDIATQWARHLEEFVPAFLARHPTLGPLAGRGDIVLHGSTTRGIDDASSDIDVWWLLTEDDLAEVHRRSPIRFFDVTAELGKNGHVNSESVDEFRSAVDQADLELIAELRSAVVVRDARVGAAELVRRAELPMPQDVRRAAFFYHYTWMRQKHRVCDTPMDRGLAVAVLLAVAPTLAHALRASLVVQGLPYPYEKWLWTDAAATPVGRQLRPHVDRILELLGPETLASGPHLENPVNHELKAVRSVLIDAARASGVDEPWLDEWWLYMTEGKQALTNVRWPED